jgi:hypothetical protein
MAEALEYIAQGWCSVECIAPERIHNNDDENINRDN